MELHKVYRVLPDEEASLDGDLRIIDESGEDYLYSVDYFVLLDVPKEIVQILTQSFVGNV